MQQQHSIDPSTTALADDVLELLWFADDDPQRSQHEASRSLAAAVAQIQGLKPFPAVAHRVLQLASKEDCRLEDVAHAIGTDPSLAARALCLASSAAFGVGKPLLSVYDALVRLGLQRMTQMVTAMSVMGMFSDSGDLGRRLRDHCVGVAALAQTLARTTSFKGHDQVFLCGLLHDVGRLLLLQTQEFTSVERGSPSDEEPHLQERRCLGYDHAVLGGHVLAAWGLSDVLSHVVAWHHQPSRAYQTGGDIGLLVAFVRVGDVLEHHLNAHQTFVPEVLQIQTRDASFEYLELDYAQIEQHADELVAARREALSVFA